MRPYAMTWAKRASRLNTNIKKNINASICQSRRPKNNKSLFRFFTMLGNPTLPWTERQLPPFLGLPESTLNLECWLFSVGICAEQSQILSLLMSFWKNGKACDITCIPCTPVSPIQLLVIHIMLFNVSNASQWISNWENMPNCQQIYQMSLNMF